MKSTNMTKEEILEKAKRDYPLGTIHKGAYGDGSFEVTDKLEYNSKNGNILPEGGRECVYDTKTNYWSIIISKPEVVITDYQIY